MYLREAESGLWPPTPHVKYIPGGHPHLPQITNILNTNTAYYSTIIPSTTIISDITDTTIDTTTTIKN